MFFTVYDLHLNLQFYILIILLIVNFLFEFQIISSLHFELSCAVENSRADLEMEQERNKALNERIAYLG